MTPRIFFTGPQRQAELELENGNKSVSDNYFSQASLKIVPSRHEHTK